MRFPKTQELSLHMYIFFISFLCHKIASNNIWPIQKLILLLSGNVTAVARGFMSSFRRNGEEYFKLDKLDIDLDIKDVRMQVKKIFHNNRILGK